jgi:cellulose 1,4-beta-cellobiosidase
MDIWESNNAATAYTPHSCNVTGTYACSGDLCSSSGVCDQAGCDFNPYRMGNKRFYGPDSTNIVDTSRKVTVVTQFHTTDNTSTGTLSAISRVYIQDGIVIANSAVNITNMEKQTPIDDEYCDAELATFGGSGAFQRQGGMAQIGDALGRGMVLVFSIWMDHGESGMLWLDGTFPLTSNGTELGSVRGPCGQTSGNNTMITNTYPDAKVVFSAIKVGELGSTFGHVSQGNDSIWLIQGR